MEQSWVRFHRSCTSPSVDDYYFPEAWRKVRRQVKVLIKNLAIFFLFPSKEFLSISFKILEDACLDLIVRKYVYNSSRIFTAQLTSCSVHLGVRTSTLYRVYNKVHRVVTAAFWRTFSHEGKISPGWWGGARPPTLITFTITSKVAVYALQLSGQTH